MLAELTIRNFAIIDSLGVSFNKGLTVLTGETGAGKSIIIDAIGLLIGGRGSSEFVRYGTAKAEIEGLFHFDENHALKTKCEEFGISVSDDMAVLRREINENGKSICRVNGKLVTLSILKEIGQTLIDIHGQHETQYLLQPDKHLLLLDSFAGKEFSMLLSGYQETYSEYKDIQKQLKKLTEDEQQIAQRLDLLDYQLQEIDAAGLQENEDNDLQEEKNKLSNFEKLYKHLHDSYENLYGDGRGLDLVSNALAELSAVSMIDEDLRKKEESLASCFYALEDLTYQIRDSFESLEYDSGRLNEIEDRLNEISKLKRKYGHSVEEILAYAEKIRKELFVIQNKDENIDALKKSFEKVKEKLMKQSEKLSQMRKKNAAVLKEAIQKELKELYMEKTQFDVMVETQGISVEKYFGPYGTDEVEFYIAPNPGEPMKPLAKTASGGELSRVILGLKSIFTKHEGVTSIIFDEVDTGVSGRVAQAIAEKIYRVSSDSQVLCITHLPQVAAMADTHLHIAKDTDGKRTVTKVTALDSSDKIQEIGRMISGVEVTDITKQHAKELLDLALQFKQTS
ncbi:DNA repair protein RecN [Fictibacillus aquaticus]|uniref:DNA repair protein RecN n=1 Tax=Fictibacillus aquaticus TaxID=2021314 RepID=A0A235FEY4_9BACL|nr:DNA repair protein RecN [Fictibacillus aquaticus]OYD59772.1 DNA repair protein RecN [Fictibacillus aquaticus]